MRIITRLRIVSAFTIASLAILGSVLVGSYVEFTQARNDNALASSIKVNFFERSSLRDQYFLYREGYVATQWDNNKETSDRLIQKAREQLRDKNSQQILEEMARNIEDSALIFHRIVKNTETLKTSGSNQQVYAELDKRLASQLLVKASEIRDGATALEESNRRTVERAYKYLTVFIILFSATLALSTILTLAFVGKLLRQRLAALHYGARIISGGNLNYRISHKGSDELTELADSINLMTDKLQAFTTQLKSEIDERKQAEQALRESETRLQAIMDSSAVAVAWANEHGIIEYANRRFTTMFGYTLEDVPTIDQWNLRAYPDPAYREKSVSEWNAEITRALREETAIAPMEFAISCKDGTVKHVILMGSWVGSRLLANFSDMTERMQAEEKLHSTNLLLDSIINNIPDMIFLKNAHDLRFELLNHAGEELLGRGRNELIGHNDYDFFPRDQADSFTSNDREVLTKNGVVSIAEELIDTPGGTRILHTKKIAIRDDLGQPMHLLGISEDITERKKAEEQLARSEASLRAILDNVPYLIWLKDMDGRFVAVNKAFFRTTGLAQMQDVLGKTDFDLWPQELAEKYHADDAEVISMRKQKLTEEMSMDNLGIHWVETFKAPITDIDGHLLGTTGFAQDITNRKNAEIQIRRLAHYDTLTDLPNRTLFSDRLQQALAIARRDKAHPALMFLDLDKFKPINDSLGHHVGDLLLKEVAKRMQDCVRASAETSSWCCCRSLKRNRMRCW